MYFCPLSLVDTVNAHDVAGFLYRGGIRRAVPKGFPYFHVEWDDGGYAHVIEGEVSLVSCARSDVVGHVYGLRGWLSTGGFHTRMLKSR